MLSQSTKGNILINYDATTHHGLLGSHFSSARPQRNNQPNFQSLSSRGFLPHIPFLVTLLSTKSSHRPKSHELFEQKYKVLKTMNQHWRYNSVVILPSSRRPWHQLLFLRQSNSGKGNLEAGPYGVEIQI